MQTPEEIIGKNVIGIRQDRGYKQRELAAKLEWPRSKLSKLETGLQKKVTATELFHLCTALQVTLMELLLPGDRALSPDLVNVRGLHVLDSISAQTYAEVLFGSLATQMNEETLSRMRPAGMLQSLRDRVLLHHPDVAASVIHIRQESPSRTDSRCN
jgi:DNA-binding Xre family transcriptional regulator